jgi:hypothetical protein
MSKPHGYVWTSLKDGMETRFTNMYPNEFYKPFDIVPVYTHPAKTLTDEEILESFAFYFGSTLNNKAYNDGAILFAKDILRKAQEK